MFVFISYNHNDIDAVGPIVHTLVSVYGKERIFFDSWSILPGDGIIDKMNDGLERCDVFFFFASKNSLESEFVKLEWQNALMIRARKNIKFVPIKLDDCILPAVLRQTCYIDLCSVGIGRGCRQMIDVLEGVDSFQPKAEYSNYAYKLEAGDNAIKLTIFVKNYYEPDARFLILVDQDVESLEIDSLSDSVRNTNKFNDLILTNESGKHKYHAFYESVSRGVSTGFPYVVKITSKTGAHFDVLGVLREYKPHNFKAIEKAL